MFGRIRRSVIAGVRSVGRVWRQTGNVCEDRRRVPVVAVSSQDGHKLNVGGGKNHEPVPGWTIVDIRRQHADVVLDISRQQLPFDNASTAAIFTSHTLEHIYPQLLEFVLREFYRVLKPGGVLRVAVPDIRKAVKAYLAGDDSFFALSEVSPVLKDAPLGGQMASWFYSVRLDGAEVAGKGEGHVHCFDYEYLAWWLRRAGFRNIRESVFRGSALEELRDERFDRYPHDSLFVEAVK